jgi:hypothetical protein
MCWVSWISLTTKDLLCDPAKLRKLSITFFAGRVAIYVTSLMAPTFGLLPLRLLPLTGMRREISGLVGI